jgi:hypothetical protein
VAIDVLFGADRPVVLDEVDELPPLLHAVIKIPRPASITTNAAHPCPSGGPVCHRPLAAEE